MTRSTRLYTLRKGLDQLGRAGDALLAASLCPRNRDARTTPREMAVPAPRVDAEVLEGKRTLTTRAHQKRSRKNGTRGNVNEALLGAAVHAPRPMTLRNVRVNVKVVPRTQLPAARTNTPIHEQGLLDL